MTFWHLSGIDRSDYIAEHSIDLPLIRQKHWLSILCSSETLTLYIAGLSTSEWPDDQPPQNRIKNRIKTRLKIKKWIKNQIKIIF